MLYVDMVINGVRLRASVNTASQATIISPAAANRCGVMQLIDKRYSGNARTISSTSTPILGRVHSAELQIGRSTLVSSLTVMDFGGDDLFLGLDMLRRFNMVIDFGEQCLKIGGDTVPFSPDRQ